MTQDDAKRIEQAAIVMLHAVNSASGNAQVRRASCSRRQPRGTVKDEGLKIDRIVPIHGAIAPYAEFLETVPKP
jgi:hypothetical protein